MWSFQVEIVRIVNIIKIVKIVKFVKIATIVNKFQNFINGNENGKTMRKKCKIVGELKNKIINIFKPVLYLLKQFTNMQSCKQFHPIEVFL